MRFFYIPFDIESSRRLFFLYIHIYALYRYIYMSIFLSALISDPFSRQTSSFIAQKRLNERAIVYIRLVRLYPF